MKTINQQQYYDLVKANQDAHSKIYSMTLYFAEQLMKSQDMNGPFDDYFYDLVSHKTHETFCEQMQVYVQD